MIAAQCFRLRPGQQVRVADPLVGSVRAEVVAWDDHARRLIIRRFDFDLGGMAEPEAVDSADVLSPHRSW